MEVAASKREGEASSAVTVDDRRGSKRRYVKTSENSIDVVVAR
jgi:hypothetical protein